MKGKKVKYSGLESGKEEKQDVRASVLASASTHSPGRNARILWEDVR